MAITYNDKYRIRRNVDHAEIMQKLQNLKIFDGYSTILCYSAILGYLHEQFIPFDKSAEPVQISFFSPTDHNLMDFLAFAHEKNTAILHEEGDKKYNIFSFYANGGFPILLKELGIDVTTNISQLNEQKISQDLYAMTISNQQNI